MISDKHLWGESWTIYRDKSVWVVGFRGKKGGESSTHYHCRMLQGTFVTYGRLLLAGDGGDEDIDLWPGCAHFLRCTTTPHRLVFAEDTEGIETYYALPGHEIDPADIVRLSPAKAPDAVPA